jgi:hypothetical protein
MDSTLEKVKKIEILWTTQNLGAVLEHLKQITNDLPWTETIKTNFLQLSAQYRFFKEREIAGVLSSGEIRQEMSILFAYSIENIKQIQAYFKTDSFSQSNVSQKEHDSKYITDNISYISEMRLQYITNRAFISQYSGVDNEISFWFTSKDFWDNINSDTVIDFKKSISYLQDVDQLLEYLDQLIKYRERQGNVFARVDATNLRKEYIKYKKHIVLKQAEKYIHVIINLIAKYDKDKIIPPEYYGLSNYKKLT